MSATGGITTGSTIARARHGRLNGRHRCAADLSELECSRK